MHPECEYEPFSVEYEVAETRRYTPDFVDGDTWYEVKGQFTASDRKKMRLLQEQYPDKDIVLVFQRPFQKIGKSPKSKTYAEWAEWAGFRWLQFA